jgi:hypothetical protein
VANSVKKLIALSFIFVALGIAPATRAKGDGFSDTVKLIEQFYHVKHQGIPFLARAGMKTATTVARISGGPRRQIAEAGSVRVAYFDDQDFSSSGRTSSFKSAINAMLAESWTPFMQIATSKGEEQTYIYLRDAGDKVNVLLVTIEPREACVLQVTLSPQNLAKLLCDPDGTSKEITVEATNDNDDRE